MRNYLLAAVALAAIASPAMARDGQPYVGIEGGILFAKDSKSDIFVDYSQTQTPTAPVVLASPSTPARTSSAGTSPSPASARRRVATSTGVLPA